LGHDLEVDHHDARSRRHRRLSRLRSLSQPPGPEIELGEEVLEEEQGQEQVKEEVSVSGVDQSEKATATLGDQARNLVDEEEAEPERQKSEDTVIAGHETDVCFHQITIWRMLTYTSSTPHQPTSIWTSPV
jgi:hypothetical protein